ncbi:polysaccharide deacetylase family protein [Salimicrobium sp. PL1-032A]|uniref:polysaccharide deacetylase family protein n=1 Tax=Salimicrobium sp. PL1-032A TaxID=3095364 RepID=UPI0032603DFE
MKVSKPFLIILLLLLAFPAVTYAEQGNGNLSALVVYSDKDQEVNYNQRYLDMLITHFTTDIEFIHESEFLPAMLEGKSHLFYQGITDDSLSSEFRDAVQTFDGSVVALGANVKELGERFSFVEPIGEVDYKEMYLTSAPDEKISSELETINVKTDAEVLAEASDRQRNYPLITKHEDSYYIGNTYIESKFSILVGEVLHDVFDTAHNDDVNRGYIRLEDVHPKVDHERLKQVADLLIERDLPFMIAVIPVYTDSETGDKYHMSDYPKVLEVLEYMQKNGGSVVMHGYTHQYRSSETGEGFEFWDVEHDSPIYQAPDDNKKLKKEKHFEDPADYEAYKQEITAFETGYIKDKLETGINELNGFGLKPLAFEAPHYTISQNGYQVVSGYFNTFVGQAQTTDDNWEVMGAPPYMSHPTFMNGMTMYPETLGFVQPENEDAVDDIIEKAEEYLILRDGMISFFYHPYLGPERLEELLDRFEELPAIDWIDLKEENTKTESSEVVITAAEGTVKADGPPLSSVASSSITFNHFVKGMADKATWLLVGTSSLAVLFFSSYTLLSRRRTEKEGRSEDLG